MPPIEHDPRIANPAELAPRFTWANPGEVVEVLNDVVDRIDPMMIMSPCDTRAQAYYCVTHRVHAANVGNLLMHGEQTAGRGDPRPHHIVVWCPRHRCYEAADPAQGDAFTRVAP